MYLLRDTGTAKLLARMQVELEYHLDENDRLVPFPGSEEQARHLVYRLADGYLRWYRHDLDDHVVTALEALPVGCAFDQPELIQAILLGRPPVEHDVIPNFFSGFFPQSPEVTEFRDAECERGRGCVLRKDSQVVSWAFSVRENSVCAEVAVETADAYRRHGYARQVTAAWAYQVIMEGREAFYSYRVDNYASAALATSLGVEIYAEVIAFD
jgi:hypothetical protein